MSEVIPHHPLHDPFPNIWVDLYITRFTIEREVIGGRLQPNASQIGVLELKKGARIQL
jgi:hypothetical protein